MFTKYREVRRLQRELTESRQREAAKDMRIASLESKLESRTNLLLERDFAWTDRFLTSQAKTYAIGNQVKETIKAETKPDDKPARLAAFMQEKRAILREYAQEATDDMNLIDSMVEQKFREMEPLYMAEFEGTQ